MELLRTIADHRELAGAVLVAICAGLGALVLGRSTARAPRFLGRVPRRPAPWIVAAGIFVIAAATTYVRPRLPAVHDEFSYLLAADTFAHGRLANPTPACAEHFETFHVIVEPSYASKYPPGQGLLLALGQVVFGHPIVGVWISAALMAAALWYALAARLSRRWSLVFAALGSLHWCATSYWSQSYWGGALAATGGALLLGGALRLARVPTAAGGAALGLGTALLALSRPFEGVVACVAAYGYVLVVWWRTRPTAPIARAALPWAAIVLALLAWTAVYDTAVTGDPLTMPYSAHEARYTAIPNFHFLELEGELTYRHAVMENFWNGWPRAKYEARHAADPFSIAWSKLLLYGPFYVGWTWLPFFLVGLASRRARGAVAVVALGAVAIWAETFDNRHYAAPYAAAVLVVSAVGAVRLLAARRAVVRGAARGALVGVALWTAASAAADPFGWQARWPERRAQLTGWLEAQPGRDVVFVAYDYSHTPAEAMSDWANIEWVYNGADIASQDVVVARDLGDASNREVLRRYGPRRGWRIVLPAALSSERITDALEPYDGGTDDAGSAPDGG
ncbi:MAG: hypothetical protein R3F34_14435 [Planctomycetota bacterium]